MDHDIEYAKVFDRACNRVWRTLTRFRGGFIWEEYVIIGLVVLMGDFILGHDPYFLLAGYVYGGVRLAWLSRQLDTGHRRLWHWVVDMAKFYGRWHLLSRRRRVAQKTYWLKAKYVVNIVVEADEDLPRRKRPSSSSPTS